MIPFDPQRHKYPSIRNVVYAKNGMVCSTQPLASQIGLEILKKGGNAMDAAVAVASALPLFEPTCNGIGSDAFALIWTDGKLYGINGSGPAPKALTAEKVRERGYTSMPVTGWCSVTVPGSPGCWAEVNKRFGRLSLAEIMAPTVRYAREGFPVQAHLNGMWQMEYEKIVKAAQDDHAPYAAWFTTFLNEGRVPQPGEIFRCPDMADTLEDLAETNCESFYRGRLAEKILAHSRATGGFLTEEDLASYIPEWVEPLSVNYKGYDVYEMPPNGHGLTVLMALNILKTMDLGNERENADAYHKTMEALKLAFVDAQKYVTDPRYMKVDPKDLLSDAYTEKRRALISEKALFPEAGTPNGSDTVYFATADGEGNMVSFIQSNAKHFGSGIVVPGTGIALQDRAVNFSLDPQADNYLEGGKKTYHTIIPGFLAKDGKPVGPFGVMGGFMQPQGHVQVVVNTVDFHMNPQEALDAPRFQWVGGKKIQFEHGIADSIAKELLRKGHDIEIVTENRNMGRGQIIWTDGTVLIGGTESRADGCIAAW